VHRKQRHTTKRIRERLRDEHGYDGGWTLVKDAVRAWRQQHQEVFLPLSHPPGEAQVDFGFADVWPEGEQTKVALFVMTLPYSATVIFATVIFELSSLIRVGTPPKNSNANW
jgi:transposase